MNRKNILLASTMGKNIITFYCRCKQYHPITGILSQDQTFEFQCYAGQTFSDLNEIVDITGSASIYVDYGEIYIKGLELYSFYIPDTNIEVNSCPVINETYEFTYTSG